MGKGGAFGQELARGQQTALGMHEPQQRLRGHRTTELVARNGLHVQDEPVVAKSRQHEIVPGERLGRVRRRHQRLIGRSCELLGIERRRHQGVDRRGRGHVGRRADRRFLSGSTSGAQIEHLLARSGLLFGADEILEAPRLEQVLVGLVEAAVVRRQFCQQLVAARQGERVADVVGNGLGQRGTGPIGLAESDETLAQAGGDQQSQALVGRSGMRGRGEALERPTMVAHGEGNPPGEDERSER